MIDVYTLLGMSTEIYEYDEILHDYVQNNIEVDGTYKYKELCELLHQDSVGGNAKKRHLRELSRYFDFEYNKKLKRYIVKEVYNTPLPPLLDGPANTIYAKHIKVLLLSYLLKSKDENPNGAVYISSHRLYEVLGMVNRKYITMQKPEHTPSLKKSLKKELEDTYKYDIEDKTINFYVKNFYARCGNKFASIVKTALDTLEKQNYITHSRAYCLYQKIRDRHGRIKYEYRYSTDEELANLLEIERGVMDEFGFKNDKDIWYGGHTREYWDRVLEVTQELYPDIHSLYRHHKIIGTKTNILRALSKEQESQEMRELNQKVLEYIDTQAEYNVRKSIDENPTDGRKHLTDRYVNAQKYLSGELIKITDNNTSHSNGEDITLNIGHHEDDPEWL